MRAQIVDVFPIITPAFALSDNWFETYVPKLIRPSYVLMVLLLVVSVGIMTLKRFENSELEKKLWNIPMIIMIVAFWPIVILGIKDLVDAFNTFLVYEIFQIRWDGFGFLELQSANNIMGLTAENMARFLPNFAYWVIYFFYIIFFFFFATLGPLILAKGILFDEIESFLEVLREVTILFLWQTTLIILVAFIMPDIVSGEPFPPHPEGNVYFLSLILGLMIFFVPSITRKFGNHLGSSFFPPGFKWAGLMLGLNAIGKIATVGKVAVGGTAGPLMGGTFQIWKRRILSIEEFHKRYRLQKKAESLEFEKSDVEHELQEIYREEREAEQLAESRFSSQFDTQLRRRHRKMRSPLAPELPLNRDRLLELARRAQIDLREGDTKGGPKP